MTRKFKLFPAAGRLRGVAAEVDARLGIALGPWMLADLWKLGLGRAKLGSAAWLGAGQPAWKRLQEVFPGLDLFSRERWEGGRVGSGRAGSEASCLSS